MLLSRFCCRPRLWQSVPSTIRRVSQASAQTFSPPPPPSRLLKVPPLSLPEEELRRDGIPGLYQPQSFAVAWYDYQDWCVQKINDRIAGTTLADQKPQSILLQTARDPEHAALFNYASMAFNNQFYFNGISLTGEPIPMSQEMEFHLRNNFSSIETLKAQMLETAYSMFGPGFVWLVSTKNHSSFSEATGRGPRKFHLVSTYLAGSPLAGAHNRFQPSDLNTENIGTAGGFDSQAWAKTRVQNAVGNFGPYSPGARNPKTSYGGIDITPVLCVNTWEHAWMLDWTINGKWQFLEAWWDRINWAHVQRIADLKDVTQIRD